MSWGKGTKATYETRCVSLHSIRNLDPLLDNERPSPTWANGEELWKSDGTAAGTERPIAASDLAKQAQGPTQRAFVADRSWPNTPNEAYLFCI